MAPGPMPQDETCSHPVLLYQPTCQPTFSTQKTCISISGQVWGNGVKWVFRDSLSLFRLVTLH